MQEKPTEGLAPANAAQADANVGPRGSGNHFALKEGDTFLVNDAFGDISGSSDGLFRDDTRVLSLLRLTLGGQAPSLLGASVSEDNVLFVAHLTNRPLPPPGDGRSIPEGVIHIERARFIWQERLYERLTFTNYSSLDTSVPVAVAFAADFRDVFEVRGQERPARGVMTPPRVEAMSVRCGYVGLDDVLRTLAISFSQAPDRLTAGLAELSLPLAGHGSAELYIEIGPDPADVPSRARYRSAAARARIGMRVRGRRGARLASSSPLFSHWLRKSRADLALLTTELPTGPYPYAGIPWFSTPFGRDAIVTSLQTLWLNPDLARGVLMFLSQNQAKETSRFSDSAPGKIMHETRKGEMSARGELPFAKYYGGVDTTPLFIVLAGAYAMRTADQGFVDLLWPSLRSAMNWIEVQCSSNQGGFLAYERGADSGLVNQAWKDSGDSIFHADGRIPDGPIAPVEVQGYVYGALRAMSSLAHRRAEYDDSVRWLAMARRLREAIEDRFWLGDECFYGLAVDGAGELCRVMASNAGHLLYSGVPRQDRASHVAHHLMAGPFNSGWGIRTLALGQARYNPMSYHNGSVWPHDVAICAAGMSRYGYRRQAARLLSGAFETAAQFDMRLPELFCGFPRATGEIPIAYPVACLPQAWAAGSVFMLLQACLGIEIDAWQQEIHVVRPLLPEGLEQLTVQNLKIGSASIDLVFQKVGDRTVPFCKGEPESVRLLAHL
jgi:glycogen debranching enzyme